MFRGELSDYLRRQRWWRLPHHLSPHAEVGAHLSGPEHVALLADRDHHLTSHSGGYLSPLPPLLVPSAHLQGPKHVALLADRDHHLTSHSGGFLSPLPPLLVPSAHLQGQEHVALLADRDHRLTSHSGRSLSPPPTPAGAQCPPSGPRTSRPSGW